MSTALFHIERLRKEFATPALAPWQVKSILRTSGLGNINDYRELVRDGRLTPLRTIKSGRKQHPRYDREQVLAIIKDGLTPQN